MKKKLNALLKYYNSEQGFAMPIAAGLGLIILLIAATMILRSQGDQVMASDQKMTAQSLSLGETGVSRIQSLFQQFPTLATKLYDSTTSPITDQWTPLFTTNAAGAACGSNPVSSFVTSAGTNGWIPVSGAITTSGTVYGHFKIIRYTPNSPSAGIGTLEISGTTDTNTTTLQNTNKPQGSISSLSVQIPYATTSIPAFKPPNLWVSTFSSVSGNKSIGQTNQTVNGNVLTQDCNTSNFDSSKNFPSGNPNNWTVFARPDLRFPSLPALPSQVAARSAVTTLGTNVTLPDDVPGVGPDPGTTDTYSYLVPSISVNSLTITSGKKVILYVQGNIDLQGNAGVSAETNALQIYGSNAAGINGPAVNYRLNSDTTGSYTTTQIGLRGNANVYAFIFAPAAISGDKGGGNSGGFYGSLWINSWVGSSFGSDSNHTVIDPPSNFNWSLLPASLLSQGGLPGQSIQPISMWQREETP